MRAESVGSCPKDIKHRNAILAMAVCSTSGVNVLPFGSLDYAPTEDFSLMIKAVKIVKKQILLKTDNLLSSAAFYEDGREPYKEWSKVGVPCVKMEAAGLYLVATRHNINALAILTISDCLVTGNPNTSKERETTFK